MIGSLWGLALASAFLLHLREWGDLAALAYALVADPDDLVDYHEGGFGLFVATHPILSDAAAVAFSAAAFILFWCKSCKRQR